MSSSLIIGDVAYELDSTTGHFVPVESVVNDVIGNTLSSDWAIDRRQHNFDLCNAIDAEKWMSSGHKACFRAFRRNAIYSGNGDVIDRDNWVDLISWEDDKEGAYTERVTDAGVTLGGDLYIYHAMCAVEGVLTWGGRLALASPDRRDSMLKDGIAAGFAPVGFKLSPEAFSGQPQTPKEKAAAKLMAKQYKW